jgi:hypothetical protein
VEVAPGLVLQNFNLLFQYRTEGGWQLSGGFNIELMDTTLSLQAGYVDDPTLGKTLTLTTMVTPPQALVSLEGVGSFSFHQLDLQLNMKQGEENKYKLCWNLRADATLIIDHILTVGGYLSLFEVGFLAGPLPECVADCCQRRPGRRHR